MRFIQTSKQATSLPTSKALPVNNRMSINDLYFFRRLRASSTPKTLNFLTEHPVSMNLIQHPLGQQRLYLQGNVISIQVENLSLILAQLGMIGDRKCFLTKYEISSFYIVQKKKATTI